MDAQTVQNLLNAAIRAATDQARKDFQQSIDGLTNRLASIEGPVRVEEYRPVEISGNVRCEESLDVVKSLPEFDGDKARYVSWRQAAHAAYKVYEAFEGSSKHYQAVAIIRNKVVGAADMVLASFNTVLNFKAILARLDFTYADKRPIYLIEQEMGTLRQGRLSIIDFYDDVERKLTLLINKTIMTNEGNDELIRSLSQKYRQDALRTFISGLNKPMCDVLFSSRPTDMPSALALAQELESNRQRSMFANSFASYNERQVPFNSPQYRRIPTQQARPGVVPMEVDASTSRFRPTNNQPARTNIERRPFLGFVPNTQIETNANRQGAIPQSGAAKRPPTSDRQVIPKIQRINNLVDYSDPDTEVLGDCNGDYYDYQGGQDEYSNQNEEVLEVLDEVNFLGESLSSPTFVGASEEKN